MKLPIHFILIAFFALSALFTGDSSPALVFFGALIGMIVPIFVENLPFVANMLSTDNIKLIKCYGQPLFGDTVYKLPLSMYVFAYLCGYFIIVFSQNKIWSSINNTLIFLALLGVTLYEGYRIIIACFDASTSSTSIVILTSLIGLIWGLIWAAIVGKKNQYKPGVASMGKCNLNKDGSTNTKYQCSLKTNGELI